MARRRIKDTGNWGRQGKSRTEGGGVGKTKMGMRELLAEKYET